jgi:hypothetical protein
MPVIHVRVHYAPQQEEKMAYILEVIRTDGSRAMRGPYETYEDAKQAENQLCSLDFQRQSAKAKMIETLRGVTQQAMSLAMTPRIDEFIQRAIELINEDVEVNIEIVKTHDLHMF